MIKSYDNTDNILDLSLEFNAIELPNSNLFNAIPMASESAKNTTHKWYDYDRVPYKSAIKTEYVAASGAMILDDTTGLRANSMLDGSGQKYRVISVTDATTLVVLYVGGETDANLAVDVEINFDGQANVEGQDFVDSDFTAPILRDNYTQILLDSAKITGTQKKISTYVSGDTISKDIMQKLERQKLLLSRSVINNTYRVLPSDNTTPRIMGGVRYYVQTNGYTSSGTFTSANLNTFFSAMKKERGAVLTEMWINPATRASFNGLDSSLVRIDRSDNTRGEYVTTFITDEGDSIEIKDDMQLPINVIDVFNVSNQLRMLPLTDREMKAEVLAKTGDSEKYQIVGEYTLEFLNSSTSGEFTITS